MKKLKKILDKEGFYIIMFLCLCILGTTAVWVAKSNVDRLAEEDIPEGEEFVLEEDDIFDVGEREVEDQTSEIIVIDGDEENEEDLAMEEIEPSSSQDVQEPEEEKTEEEKLNSPITKKGKQLVENETDKKDIEIVEALPEEEQSVKIIETSAEDMALMAWPVKGDIGMGFAVETLAYSKTLEHFTTHHGIDIMAEEKTPVKAAMDGEVIEVLTDSRLGITIAIKHEEGLITRYSNLYTDKMVKLGDKVAKGQTISGVGTSSLFESAEDPHLHFEVLKDGENVDPLEYLAFE